MMKIPNLVLAILAAILFIPLAASSLADESARIAKRNAIMTPQNRAEAFRTMDTAFPYHVIKRAGPVSELPRAERPLDVRDMLGDAGLRRMLTRRGAREGALLAYRDHRPDLPKCYSSH